MLVRRFLFPLVVALPVAMGAARAEAETVFQSVPNLSSPTKTFGFGSGGAATYYSVFTITADIMIDTISALFHSTGFPADITVSIHTYPAAKTVGTLVHSETFAKDSYTVVNPGGVRRVATFDVSDWLLTAGTYLISFYNPTRLNVLASSDGSTTKESFSVNSSGVNSGSPYSAAFAFEGEVVPVTPVPGPVAAAGLPGALALIGFAAWRRRRARVAS